MYTTFHIKAKESLLIFVTVYRKRHQKSLKNSREDSLAYKKARKRNCAD